MMQALRPRMVESIQHQVGVIFNDRLDDLSALEHPDRIRDAVEPYPGLVMGPILGVPFAEAKELDRWAFQHPRQSPGLCDENGHDRGGYRNKGPT